MRKDNQDDNTETTWMLNLSDRKCESRHHKNDSMSNYEHIWNKWKHRKFQQKKKKSLTKEIKKNQVDILGLKNTITKIKITPQMSPRVEQTEQRISELKEIT